MKQLVIALLAIGITYFHTQRHFISNARQNDVVDDLLAHAQRSIVAAAARAGFASGAGEAGKLSTVRGVDERGVPVLVLYGRRAAANCTARSQRASPPAVLMDVKLDRGRARLERVFAAHGRGRGGRGSGSGSSSDNSPSGGRRQRGHSYFDGLPWRGHGHGRGRGHGHAADDLFFRATLHADSDDSVPEVVLRAVQRSLPNVRVHHGRQTTLPTGRRQSHPQQRTQKQAPPQPEPQQRQEEQQHPPAASSSNDEL